MELFNPETELEFTKLNWIDFVTNIQKINPSKNSLNLKEKI